MVKKKTKTHLLCALCLCLFVCLSVFFAFTVSANAQVEELQTSYELNETLVIPQGTVSYNGETHEATSVSLLYPSGVAKSGDTHLLDEAGVYTVRYEASVEGKSVREEKTFRVNYDLFTSATGESAFGYGTHAYAPKKEGLVVSVPNKDTLTANQIIDLTKLTKHDNIISFFFTPTNIGTADCNETQIVLTDVYDPNNYVTIRFRSLSKTDGVWADPQTYIAANWTGGPTIGASHVGDKYGYPIQASITGNKAAIGSQIWSISMDYANRQIWTPTTCMYSSYVGKPIADLDDSTITRYTWDGFTTGEVYLSIRGAQYNASSLNLVITDIAGVNLTATTCADTTAPTIAIDTGDYAENALPNGKKGVPYKIFPATAHDAYAGGEVDVQASVYRNYGTKNQSEYSLKNGCFVPQYTGEYTILYRARDRFNNLSEKQVAVQVDGNSENLDFEVEGKAVTGVAGEKVTLLQGISVTGEEGTVSTRVTATIGDKTYEADENFQIVSVYAGVYTVKVEVSDYLETKAETFEVTLSTSDKPAILQEFVFPAYFITGQKYSLPNGYGYDVRTAMPQEIPAKIYIVEDNGAEKEVTANAFTVKAKNSLLIIYRVTNGVQSTDKAYACAVRDVGFGDTLRVSEYFVCDGNVSVTAAAKNVSFTTRENNAQVAFINSAQMEEFVLKFNVDGSKNQFEKVNVYLIDSQDFSQCVKFTYGKGKTYTYFAVNDGQPFSIPSNFDGTSADAFMLDYNNEGRTVRPFASLSVNVDKTVTGEEFFGFTSNKAYITFEFVGVTGESSVILYSINNQSFFDFDIDFMAPQIFTNKQSGDVNPGDKVTVYGARSYDVLDNYCSLTLKVVSPSGSLVTSDDNVVLDTKCDATKDYLVTATEYGNYSVIFTAKDSSGNSVVFRYGFTVVEDEPPTVSVETTTAYGKVGQAVQIREATATDNVTASDKLTVYVFVTAPDCVTTQINDTEFMPTKKGKYTVYYYCSDAMGNTSVVSYDIIVS